MKAIRFSFEEMNLSEVIVDYLNSNIEVIQPALSFSQCDQNDKVEVGDISIKEVRFLRDGIVEVEYEYEWSFYSGCKDINDAGTETETIQGKLNDGHIDFTVFQSPESRTTDEEF